MIALLTIEDAAHRLNVSPSTVKRLVRQHCLAAVHVGRSVRFRPGDVDAYVAGLPVTKESA